MEIVPAGGRLEIGLGTKSEFIQEAQVKERLPSWVLPGHLRPGLWLQA
jgi:hypothetical protein